MLGQNDKIRQQLAVIREEQQGFWNIAPGEGEYVYRLVKILNARLVLEIGTSNGYSSAWFALGLQETDGTLITLEADADRYALAQQNFRALGLTAFIDSRLGDAMQLLTTLSGPFDIVLIDAWKPDYLTYYEAVLPKVRPGGVILAHNVISHATELQEYLAHVQQDRAVSTEIVTLGPQGFAVSTKL